MAKRNPVPAPDGHQPCFQCAAIKPYADFEPTRKRAAGIKSTCRACLTADREVAAMLDEVNAEGVRRQYAPTTAATYKPPLGPIPESERKTDEYFRGLDAGRRRMRLQRGK